MNKRLLDALVEELPDKLGAIFGLTAGERKACTTFSRLLAEVLSEFGIASEVRLVYVETANQAGIDYLQGKISFEEAMRRGGKIQVLGDIRMGQPYQHAVCYIPAWDVIVDLTVEPRLSRLVPSHPYWAEWGQLPWWIRGFEFRNYPLEYRVYETRPAEVKRAKEIIRDIVVRRYLQANPEPLYPHVPKKKEPLYPHQPRGEILACKAEIGVPGTRLTRPCPEPAVPGEDYCPLHHVLVKRLEERHQKSLSQIPSVPQSKEPFIKVGERVRFIASSKYRYETWPKDKWLEYSVSGTVIEYHPESPEVRIRGEIFEALPPYAIVRWDLGGSADTVIDPDDEGERWERIKAD